MASFTNSLIHYFTTVAVARPNHPWMARCGFDAAGPCLCWVGWCRSPEPDEDGEGLRQTTALAIAASNTTFHANVRHMQKSSGMARDVQNAFFVSVGQSRSNSR